MSSNNNEGPGIVSALIIVGIIAIFIFTGIGPIFDQPGANDLNLGDSVVTRQDSNKLGNYQSDFDKLSRSKIQEKLNRVPVFYLSDGEDNLEGGGSLFLSFEDATDAAKAGGEGLKVKATTLDQVIFESNDRKMSCPSLKLDKTNTLSPSPSSQSNSAYFCHHRYPLVFKRGRMRMAPPPPAIKKAEEALTAEGDGAATTSFKLVPSKAAIKDARDTNLVLASGDIPLFVAERLAFAGSDGPQVPLFLEKDDCITSYNRLRETSTRLPAEPNIRTTTLKDVLYSMEKGTRPAVSQLQFYATADDLVRAAEMM